MNQEGIILSEISQSEKTNMAFYHSYVECKISKTKQVELKETEERQIIAKE